MNHEKKRRRFIAPLAVVVFGGLGLLGWYFLQAEPEAENGEGPSARSAYTYKRSTRSVALSNASARLQELGPQAYLKVWVDLPCGENLVPKDKIDVGECHLGVFVQSGNDLVCQGVVTPQPEVCDGKDNDCDGEIDEEPDVWEYCQSSDNPRLIGECQAGHYACVDGKPDKSTCVNEVKPKEDEYCNGAGRDYNCDGKPGVVFDQFEDANSDNGMRAVYNDGDVFFINEEKCEEICPSERLERTLGFSEGLASVRRDGEWFYMDTDCRDAFRGERFDRAGRFLNDLAEVKRENKSFLIDKQGRATLPGRSFDELNICEHEDKPRTFYAGENNHYLYLNSQGHELFLGMRYKEVFCPDKETGFLFIHDDDDLRFFLTIAGQEAFPGHRFTQLSNFFNGIAVGWKGDEKFLLYRDGRIVTADE